MIIFPATPDQWGLLARFLLERAGVQPSADLKLMGWMDESKRVRVVVGFNGFMGKVCQMHVAMEDYAFSPRKMLKRAFEVAFDDYRREQVIGLVNSKNGRAVAYDLHLGFKEAYRFPGMHDDGGDIVVLTMTRAECRHLNDNNGRLKIVEDAA